VGRGRCAILESDRTLEAQIWGLSAWVRPTAALGHPK